MWRSVGSVGGGSEWEVSGKSVLGVMNELHCVTSITTLLHGQLTSASLIVNILTQST